MAVPPTVPDPAPGLPPVVAPSGRHIVQLFLVPGMIVAGAVTVLLGFSWLAGGPKTPKGYIDGLRSGNFDVRWRIASDLAQVLPRDAQLSSDPAFALELAELLKSAAEEYERMEKARSQAQGRADEAQADAALVKQRGYLQYLYASAGSMTVPVAAPVLAGLAQKSPSRDPQIDALLRRQAVWSLATLGGNRMKWDALPAERKTELATILTRLASQSPGEQAGWARSTAGYLERGESLGVIDALVACAGTDDPFLRTQAALALTFWVGTPEENARADDALLRLTRDDGHGLRIEIPDTK